MIVDLHTHSKFSRATSKEADLEGLYYWGKIKGINVVGTGDVTHPGWLSEMKEKLLMDKNGLLRLKEKIRKEIDKKLPESVKKEELYFTLTGEISNIYSKNGVVRKMHNLVMVPDFRAAAELQARLSRIGNIKSDGRPIFGLDSKELLKMILEIPFGLMIPAHIWTPWFSLFGSKSGFDSISEAFEELTDKIVAVETGLSSDPFMNWRWSKLDGITLVSNSDAHSPPKLGREANLLSCPTSYQQMVGAIKSNDKRMKGTIEFFPEEGKYHYDGHRSCQIRFKPSQTKKHKGLCPKCGKPLVVGVMYRVDQLADRGEKYKPKRHKRVEYIIPLPEIVAEINGVKTVSSRKVVDIYRGVISCFGSELKILREIPIKEIKEIGYLKLSRAIDKMRKGEIKIKPGYDGVFGEIKIELEEEEQTRLF